MVLTSSLGHRMGRLSVEDLNFEHRTYSAWEAYGQSKLANLLFVRELQHRADAAGRSLLAVAAHPGNAATNLTRGTAASRLPVLGPLLVAGASRLGQSDAGGALPLLYAGHHARRASVGVLRPGRAGGRSRAPPTRVGMTAAATDDTAAAALWDLSQRLTGVIYDWA